MSVRDRRVVVVGGGIIGATSAYFLERAGWEVTIIDRGAFGEGAAVGNCGLISPSHILPLAEPGVIRKVIQAMMRPDSAFSVRPGINLELWSWLIHFARRANTREMLEAAHGIHALLDSSVRLYRELLDREHLECEWEHRGLLAVYQDRHLMEEFRATNDLLTDEFGFPAKPYDSDGVAALEPALKPGMAGGWYYEQDAHLRPERLFAAWRRLLESRNVKILEQCEAKEISSSDGRARAVVTNQGGVPADAVVVATGALTPMLNNVLGCRVPIQPGKGYSITMPRPSICPRIPLLFPEKKVIVTPFASGYRIGSTMQFAGYDDTLDRRRLNILDRGAAAFLREPHAEPVEREWYGWRPMTYDSLPIIDFTPRYRNVLIAAGHNMLGLSMSPGTGRLVSELLSDEAPHVDPTPYRLERFGA